MSFGLTGMIVGSFKVSILPVPLTKFITSFDLATCSLFPAGVTSKGVSSVNCSGLKLSAFFVAN